MNKWWYLLGGVLAALVLLIAAGPWVYKNWIVEQAKPELALPSRQSPAVGDLNGTWKVVGGPEEARTTAGYRVDEVLRGVHVTVNGRTSQVTGGIAIGDNTVQSGDVTVDVASITTDQSQRDNQFRGKNIMDVATYPTANFRITSPVSLENLPSDGSPRAFDALGVLTLHGVNQEISVVLNAQRSGSLLVVQGSIPLRWENYQVQTPSLGFVTVEDHGTVEFLVNFSK